MAEWLFVLLICIFPSTFHLQEDNFPAFSGPDWYHFSSNDSFYFPRNECREISKKYKNGYCLKEPTTPTGRHTGKRASPGTSHCGHRRMGTLVLGPSFLGASLALRSSGSHSHTQLPLTRSSVSQPGCWASQSICSVQHLVFHTEP